MNGPTRVPKRFLVVAATIASLAALAMTAPVLASSPRSGSLQVSKVCSPQTPPALSFCTITSSSLDAIEVGSKVVYLQPAGPTALDSDVRLVVGPGNVAFGHVHLPFPVGPGVVTFSGGTGKFTWFQANVVVTRDFTVFRGWFWNGTYSFSPPND
jgi:hypothetical protein